MSVLEVDALTLDLPGRDGPQRILDEVGLSIDAGEVVGLAGESGSGKSMTALAVLGMLPAGARLGGAIRFRGTELVTMPAAQRRRLRGAQIAMVAQDPASTLHPMLTVETLLTEHQRWHLGLDRRAAVRRAVELLDQVRIPDARRALARHPGEFSGGMRQRIAIAIALACGPSLLLADEPTTALDVTVQAGIMRLIDDLVREQQLAVLLVTHDLGVLSGLADRINVLYRGRIVESGPSREVLTQPVHDYTRRLCEAVRGGRIEPVAPRIDAGVL